MRHKFAFAALLIGLTESASALNLALETQVRVLGFYADNPADDSEVFYREEADSGGQFLLRESAILKFRKYFKLEANVFGLVNYVSSEGSLTTLLLNSTDESNRSSYMQRHWYNKSYVDSYLVTDRFALSYAYKRVKAVVGRFPINLSNLTIFRPNDLFAPFKGQSLYRKYKAGVDGAELELQVKQLSRINVYAVRGYLGAVSLGGDDEEANRFAYQESSIMVRGSTVFKDWNLALLGGKYRSYDLYGGSVQGEVGDYFELSFEGHFKSHRTEKLSNTLLNLGVAKRFGENLLANFEYFSNGAGYTVPEDYFKIISDVDPPKDYLGRDYIGTGFDYTLTPLTTLKELILFNLTDTSFQSVSSVAYSFRENMDVALTLYLPVGKGPTEDGNFGSEYGTYPTVLQVDLAAYF